MRILQKPLHKIAGEFLSHKMRNNNYFALTLVVALASILTVIYLGKKSLWQDEAASVILAKQDWETFSLVMSRRTNMQLYHMMLHWWIQIGQSEFIVRSLSAIFALATVPVIYALGATIFGLRVGILAALLLAVNAFFIQYAQEARAYSLVLLLVTLSSYFFLISIERPSWRSWVGYVICSTLAVYSHLFAVFVFLTQGVSLVFLRRRDVQWRSLLISEAAVILMTLPLTIKVLSGGKFGLSWMPQPNLYSLVRVFYHLAGGSLPLLIGYFLLCFYTLIIAIRTFVKYKRSVESWHYFFILTWLFIPIVLSFFYSLYKPIFWPRYLIICLPSLILLGGVGLSNLQRRSGRIFEVSLVIMLILSGSALINWYTRYDKEGGENWREVTRYVLSRVQTGDTIFFEPPYASLPFDYYLHRLDARRKIPASIYYSSESYVTSGIRKRRSPVLDETSLEQLPGQYKRFWLVGRNLSQLKDEQRSVGLTSLQRKSRLLESQQFKKITLLLYETLPPR
jgi:mannosyltransferase